MVSIELAKRVAHVAARLAPLTTLEKLRYSTVMAIAGLSDPADIPEDTTSPLPKDLALVIEPKPTDLWSWDISLEFVGSDTGIEEVGEHEGYDLYFYPLADLGIGCRADIVPYLKSEAWADVLRIVADIYDTRNTRKLARGLIQEARAHGA